jgi:probable O-glycosylation ligase (exosortase A-associated)
VKQLLLTYALTYGGALASLIRPYTGLLVYVGFAIITPEALWPWAVPRGNYSRIVAIGLLVGWVIHGCGSWNFGRAKPVIFALMGFWAWLCLSSFFARNQELAWDAVEAESKIFLPCLVALTLINSVKQVKQLVWVIVLTNGYLAEQFNEQYYTTLFLPEEFHYRGTDNNGIALTMVTGFGLAFFLAVHAERWWQKLLAIGAAGLMAHVVIFSMSRGGMLGLCVTGGVAFFLIPKTWKHYLFFALALAIVIRLAGPQVVKRFDSTFADAEVRDASANSRVEQWRACAVAMTREPVFGVGTHGWRYVALEFGATIAREAHSTWFQVGAEMGFPGLGLLALFYGACAVRLLPLTRRRSQVSDPWMRHLSCMVIASLAGFVVSSQFVTADGVEMPYYVGLVGAGVLKLSSLTAAESVTEASRGAGHIAYAAPAA